MGPKFSPAGKGENPLNTLEPQLSFLTEKIIIVIAIPMLKSDTEYEVYRVISIPILLPVTINHSCKSRNTEFLATNKLESNGFLNEKARIKYQLLTDSEIQACSHKKARFCTVYSPVFSRSLSNTCLINLFISITDTTRHYCFT